MKLFHLINVYIIWAMITQSSMSNQILVHHNSPNSTLSSLLIELPKHRPEAVDSYVCTSKRVSDYTGYIVGFNPNEDARKNAHHVLIMGCSGMDTKLTYTKCMMNTHCTGRSIIVYAWAKSAPALKLPKDVGFKIGRGTDIKYLVLQVHYGPNIKSKLGLPNFIDSSGVTLQLSTKSQRYSAGMYDFASNYFVIRPHSTAKDDLACRYNQPYELHPFAFRVHAHQIGVLISGYIVRDGKWILIGESDPRKPNAFFPIQKEITIKKDDLLFVRCVFKSNRDRPTYLGSRHSDEMCNYYIMYYTNHREAIPYHQCEKQASTHLSLLAPKKTVAQDTNGIVSHKEQQSYQNPSDTAHQQSDDDNDLEELDMERNQVDTPLGNAESIVREDTSNSALSTLKLVPNWPAQFFLTGDIGGVAVSKTGNVFIFHRGDRHWERNTFDSNFRFQFRGPPIATDTIMELDPDTGDVVRKFGKNLFYLPHGIAVDDKNNVWVTDSALHQVYKFKANSKRPSMVLGVKFKPGNDTKHFCQPSGIAVSKKTGIIYVADGYCNSRIVRFRPDGSYLDEFTPIAYHFMKNRKQIIHSVTIDDENDKLYVVDKRNDIIFHIDMKHLHFIPFGKNNRLKVVSAKFNPAFGGVLYAVSKEGDGDKQISRGYTLDASTGSVMQSWQPNHEYFDDPHDIAVSPDNSAVYVVELKGGRILKFMYNTHNSVHKPTMHGTTKKCTQTCVQTYSPVCGSNGQTYTNQCLLEHFACIQNLTITKVEEGPCPIPTTRKATPKPKPKPTTSKPKPTESCKDDCPRIYDPICGSNGKTFDNECLMKYTICKTGQIIEVSHFGPCKRQNTQPKPTERKCDPMCVYDPKNSKQVCGSDGKTYNSECSLRYEACNNSKVLTIHNHGPCPSKSTNNIKLSTTAKVQTSKVTTQHDKTDHATISTSKPAGFFNLSFASIALMVLVLVVVVPLAIFVIVTVVCRYRANKRRSRYLSHVTGYKGRNSSAGCLCCKKGSYGFFLDENQGSYKRNLYFPDDDDDDDEI
ncbi:Peptidyl-glycine alpha-amidating monooxygenase A [Trichoplax sp. H2]|nr:Peptidyl-glycine alpha-amidating monooxygenase A [Trichoplax sp. H2]|eukprot:RDD43780.1 Peptidyl-glycine alpha-amidating monooxygenase A [Trichoplax sp. H2]